MLCKFIKILGVLWAICILGEYCVDMMLEQQRRELSYVR